MPKFLNETSKTGDGTRVKLGDTIEVDLFNPITAKITSISQHKNGKVFNVINGLPPLSSSPRKFG